MRNVTKITLKPITSLMDKGELSAHDKGRDDFSRGMNRELEYSCAVKRAAYRMGRNEARRDIRAGLEVRS